MPLGTWQEKVDTKKAQLSKALFGLVLNWAFVAQGGSRTVIVEEINILIEQIRKVLRCSQSEVEIQFFLDPSIKRFNYWVICWSSPSRH